MNRRTRGIAIGVLLLALAATPFLITVEPPAPPEGWHVNVRWAASVNESSRRELEAQYALKLLQPNSGRTFVYRLGNTSRDNIRALVQDARVEDTHGIDRARFSVPAPRVTLARRYLDEHEDAAEAVGAAVSWTNALLVLVALVAWRAARHPRVLAFVSRGIPPMSSAALGLYRVALGAALIAVVLKYNDLPDTPFPRELHRGHDWFANWDWVHALASRPDLASWTTPIAVALLLAFALGVFARPAYIAFLVMLTVHVLVVLQHKSAHDWGLPLVTLWGLAVVRWSDAPRIDRLRGSEAARARDHGFAAWFPGLMIGLAFFAAAYAKLDSSGLDWVAGGAVKYHFIEDSRQAPTAWGLWVAAHHPAAVAMSAAAVLIEGCFILHVLFRSAWIRAAFGLAGLALLVGFRLLQGVVWTQWWVLFLCFVPWQAIVDRLGKETSPAAARIATSPLGGAAALVTTLMVVVQVFASAHRLEAEPFVSDYGMYSWTWPSRDAFDRQMARKYRRYRYREWTGGRAGDDISGSLSALPKADDVLADAVDRLRGGEPLGDEQQHALSAIAAAYRAMYGRDLDAIAVAVSEQVFDWSSGRFRVTSEDERVGVLDLSAGRLVTTETARLAGRK